VLGDRAQDKRSEGENQERAHGGAAPEYVRGLWGGGEAEMQQTCGAA